MLNWILLHINLNWYKSNDEHKWTKFIDSKEHNFVRTDSYQLAFVDLGMNMDVDCQQLGLCMRSLWLLKYWLLNFLMLLTSLPLGSPPFSPLLLPCLLFFSSSSSYFPSLPLLFRLLWYTLAYLVLVLSMGWIGIHLAMDWIHTGIVLDCPAPEIKFLGWLSYLFLN